MTTHRAAAGAPRPQEPEDTRPPQATPRGYASIPHIPQHPLHSKPEMATHQEMAETPMPQEPQDEPLIRTTSPHYTCNLKALQARPYRRPKMETHLSETGISATRETGDGNPSGIGRSAGTAGTPRGVPDSDNITALRVQPENPPDTLHGESKIVTHRSATGTPATQEPQDMFLVHATSRKRPCIIRVPQHPPYGKPKTVAHQA